MGVDINGKNPILHTSAPAEIDYTNSTELEREIYFTELSKWHDENPGAYFRANWWSWRPIAVLSQMASNRYGLNFDFSGWGSNDGRGLDDEIDCNRLADAIENLLEEAQYFSEDDDHLYVCMGSWNNDEGRLVSGDVEKFLNLDYPVGTVLKSAVVGEGGEVYYPTHKTYYSHVKDFIKFLRECGGFEIF